jgi:hypothetical protein
MLQTFCQSNKTERMNDVNKKMFYFFSSVLKSRGCSSISGMGPKQINTTTKCKTILNKKLKYICYLLQPEVFFFAVKFYDKQRSFSFRYESCSKRKWSIHQIVRKLRFPLKSSPTRYMITKETYSWQHDLQ